MHIPLTEVIKAYGRIMYEAGVREKEPSLEKWLTKANDTLDNIEKLIKNKGYMDNNTG